MLKNEFFLQIFFILLTASLVALIGVKYFPIGIFSPLEAEASTLVDPVPPSLTIKLSTASPTKITISAINLDLPIAPGVIVDNKWTLFLDKISWLSTSSRVGEGNTILYGHNRLGLFGGLKELNIGDEIIITQDSKIYKFKISQQRKVLPTDVEAILSGKNQLTLYTCDGSFDQRRLIVIALPE